MFKDILAGALGSELSVGRANLKILDRNKATFGQPDLQCQSRAFLWFSLYPHRCAHRYRRVQISSCNGESLLL